MHFRTKHKVVWCKRMFSRILNTKCRRNRFLQISKRSNIRKILQKNICCQLVQKNSFQFFITKIINSNIRVFYSFLTTEKLDENWFGIWIPIEEDGKSVSTIWHHISCFLQKITRFPVFLFTSWSWLFFQNLRFSFQRGITYSEFSGWLIVNIWTKIQNLNAMPIHTPIKQKIIIEIQKESL